MRMRRQAGALILYGGWLLLFNPEANRPDAPLSSWKKRGEYDTGYLCEQARSKSVADLLREQRQRPDTPRLRPAAAELRYRCERAERFVPFQPRCRPPPPRPPARPALGDLPPRQG